jgi:hypothetical protein
VLVATPFRKDGAVRQQDVAENKHLATILERLRQNQIADDAPSPSPSEARSRAAPRPPNSCRGGTRASSEAVCAVRTLEGWLEACRITSGALFRAGRSTGRSA